MRCSFRGLEFGPSTHFRRLTCACRSSSRASMLSESLWGTCAYAHVTTYIYTMDMIRNVNRCLIISGIQSVSSENQIIHLHPALRWALALFSGKPCTNWIQLEKNWFWSPGSIHVRYFSRVNEWSLCFSSPIALHSRTCGIFLPGLWPHLWPWAHRKNPRTTHTQLPVFRNAQRMLREPISQQWPWS